MLELLVCETRLTLSILVMVKSRWCLLMKVVSEFLTKGLSMMNLGSLSLVGASLMLWLACVLEVTVTLLIACVVKPGVIIETEQLFGGSAVLKWFLVLACMLTGALSMKICVPVIGPLLLVSATWLVR